VPTKEEEALWTGLMVSFSFVVMAFISPIWGQLSDRYGRKAMLIRSTFAGSIIVLLLSLTTEVWQVFVLRLLQGAFAGSVTAAVALFATITPKEKMGFCLGLMQTAVFAGQSLGPTVGGFLADHFGYRQAFLITCGLMFISTGLTFFFIKENFVRKPVVPRPADTTRWQAFTGNWTSFLSNRQFLTMCLVLAMLQFSSIMLYPVLPIFIQAHHSGALEQAGLGVSSVTGLIFGVTGLASAVSAVIAGRLSDKLGHRRILIISAFGGGLVGLPLLLVSDTLQLLIVRGMMGLFIGGILPSANAIIGGLTPEDRRGAAYGVTQSVSSIGMSLGPLTGAILVATLDARLVFALTAALLLFISLWVSRVLPRQTALAPAVAAQPSTKSAS
jgi:DHA1 family multidrug resistance protein-like MFS transporter